VRLISKVLLTQFINPLFPKHWEEASSHERDRCGGHLIAILRLGGVDQRRYASLLAKVYTPLILS
jgi:hypothetical protein